MEMPAEPVRDVSVVIPARNEARCIERCLASVAAQCWPLEQIEAVVVDNGSTDGTADVVRAFAEAHPALQVRLVSEPRPGVARARNRGVAAATGRWVLFLDADSCLAPDLVSWVVHRGGHIGYPAGSIRIVADSSDRIDRAFFDLLEFGKVLFGIRAQMYYCDRELFQRLGGLDATLQVGEDQEFLRRLQRAGVPVCHLRESWIATSTRRLHTHPFRLGLLGTFARWALAHSGVGRRWRY